MQVYLEHVMHQQIISEMQARRNKPRCWETGSFITSTALLPPLHATLLTARSCIYQITTSPRNRCTGKFLAQGSYTTICMQSALAEMKLGQVIMCVLVTHSIHVKRDRLQRSLVAIVQARQKMVAGETLLSLPGHAHRTPTQRCLSGV